MKKAFLYIFFLVSSLLFSADHCILDGGSGDGSAWNNAWDDLPTDLVRGDTYYVGDGTYGSYTFDDDNSGTTRIIIKKATVADHGTETGWDNDYGDGQALFRDTSGGAVFEFTGGYYTIDGVGRGSDWKSNYGFKLDTSYSGTGGIKGIVGTGLVAFNVIIRYAEIELRGDNDYGDDCVAMWGPGSTAWTADWTVQYCYFHDTGRTIFICNEADDFLIEYCWFARNQSTGGEHAEGISATLVDNYIVRNNIWEDIEGTGVIVFAGDNWEVYGNLMFYSSGYSGWGCDNGVIATWGANACDDIKIYNNTFVDLLNGSSNQNFTLGFTEASSNIVAYNNFWFNSSGGFSNVDTHDYNMADSDLGEAHSQHWEGGSDIFVDYANDDFHLAQNTDAGMDLGSSYNTDMDGVTRSNWDRGAYEYEASIAPAHFVMAFTLQTWWTFIWANIWMLTGWVFACWVASKMINKL